jgi:hypothetical protein
MYNQCQSMYEGGSKSCRPDQLSKVTNETTLLFKFAIFQYSLATYDAIYPSQHFPFGAAFVSLAGNFWTHPRTVHLAIH